MGENTATTLARRRLNTIAGVRALFSCVVGAAAALAVIGAVRLFSGQQEVFPTVIVPLLVLVGVVGEGVARRRYGRALDDLELAARNVVRGDTLG